jgi:hypothetical protein
MPRKARIDMCCVASAKTYASGALNHILCRGIERRKIFYEGIREPLRVKARSLVCYWAIRELGMSGTSVGNLLSLGRPAVSRAVVRGEKLTQDLKLILVE